MRRFLYTGPIGDWLAIRITRKNHGIMDAEYRLWLVIPFIILLPFGFILWGVGADHHIHWFGLVFAMGVISFVTTAQSQIWVTYCVDSYRDLGGEALTTVILIRNTMYFAASYG